MLIINPSTIILHSLAFVVIEENISLNELLIINFRFLLILLVVGLV